MRGASLSRAHVCVCGCWALGRGVRRVECAHGSVTCSPWAPWRGVRCAALAHRCPGMHRQGLPVRHRSSQVFGGADAEQGQAACEHRPGGFGEGEPGAVGGRGFLVAERAATAAPGSRGRRRRCDEVPGEAVGGAVAGGGGEDAGVVGDGGEQRAGVGPRRCRTGPPGSRGAAALRVRARVRAWAYRTRKRGLLSRWTRCSSPMRGAVVGGGAQQGPAGGVAAEAQGGGGLPGRGRGGRVGSARGGRPHRVRRRAHRAVAQRRVGSASQVTRTRAPWERRMRRGRRRGRRRGSRGAEWSWCEASRCRGGRARNEAPCSSTSAHEGGAGAGGACRAASRVMLRNPGPVISTPRCRAPRRAAGAAPRRPAAATRPAARASCRATLVA